MKYKRKEVIGDCTLYLGDCMNIMSTLGKVDAVVTDPPYGMNYQSNRRKNKRKKIVNDDNDECYDFLFNLKYEHSLYMFGRWENIPKIAKPKSIITWVKNNWSMGDLNHEHARQTELLFFYNGKNHFFPNGRPSDFLQIKKTDNNLHPTQKPVDLMRCIINWTDGIVIDPFMGSGTTGVACAKLCRKFIGIEIEEKYFDIACKRIEEAYQQPDMFINTKSPEKPK